MPRLEYQGESSRKLELIKVFREFVPILLHFWQRYPASNLKHKSLYASRNCMDVVVVSKLSATDWREALKRLCEYAVNNGYAKKTLVDAILNRERRCPTGFPIENHRGVALPHEDVVHAKKPIIIIAKPTNPILFGRIDNAEKEIEALLIILVIVNDVKRHLNTIEKLTPLLKDIKLVEKVREISLPELKQEMLSNLGEEFARFEIVELS